MQLVKFRYFKFPYMCISNNNTTRLDSKNIPITKDIAEYLNKFGEGVDFFIVVVKGLLDDSVSVCWAVLMTLGAIVTYMEKIIPKSEFNG